MDLSFQEKSLWVVLAGLIGGFGLYFKTVLPDHGPDVMPHQIVLFTVVIVLMVIVQIVGHALIAAMDQRTQTDERDRTIGMQGGKVGGYVLATGVFCALCTAVIVRGNFAVTHVLLAFWALAEIAQIAAQLFLYRRGA